MLINWEKILTQIPVILNRRQILQSIVASGVPLVVKTPHINDVNLTSYAYSSLEKIYEAVGSTEIYNLPAYPVSHNIGTNRMSEKANDGVMNKWGQHMM